MKVGKELTPGVVTSSKRVGVSRNHKIGESLQHYFEGMVFGQIHYERVSVSFATWNGL